MTHFREAIEELNTYPCEPVSLVLGDLSGDELDVIGWVIERLRLGRERYGPLALGADNRDHARERDEEIADALVYAACLALGKLP